MIGQREIIILVATLSLLGGAFAYGYHKGTVNQIEKFEEDRQELQNDLLDLNETLSVKNAEILRLNREKEGLINELENQALTAEGSSAPGIATTGGLQRLERRWGPVTTAP
ncbi:hypothetical protein PP753_gp43 [Dinoroseobacter phage vB_DshP-R7L]|uniref:Uncharacterized protein n=1 Tax=Dinoroseobacter phage vB_DshP-R7L TaxID=2873349 RepID=A0AAE8XBX4_9CAUD|nr:hypothetical protein PP753_gp43 [Dinoroseobacter phage vB_DshP-R7L]UAT28915.1 hypothetical protein R7L_gp76 [Dinoroseobacter phage vB_DshP-R7L]